MEANWPQAKNSQKYDASSPNTFRIQTQVKEFTGAMCVQPYGDGKRLKRLFWAAAASCSSARLYLEIQGLPDRDGVRQIKPAFLYGGRRRLPRDPFLALRLQYRGFV